MWFRSYTTISIPLSLELPGLNVVTFDNNTVSNQSFDSCFQSYSIVWILYLNIDSPSLQQNIIGKSCYNNDFIEKESIFF